MFKIQMTPTEIEAYRDLFIVAPEEFTKEMLKLFILENLNGQVLTEIDGYFYLDDALRMPIPDPVVALTSGEPLIFREFHGR